MSIKFKQSKGKSIFYLKQKRTNNEFYFNAKGDSSILISILLAVMREEDSDINTIILTAVAFYVKEKKFNIQGFLEEAYKVYDKKTCM